MSKYSEQIAAGMAVLDQHVPGWEHRINLKKLTLIACDRCVVGQLAGEQYFYGVRALGIAEIEGSEWPHEYGFGLEQTDDGYEIGSWRGLTTAWKRAIRARLAPSTGSGQAAQATGSERR